MAGIGVQEIKKVEITTTDGQKIKGRGAYCNRRKGAGRGLPLRGA